MTIFSKNFGGDHGLFGPPGYVYGHTHAKRTIIRKTLPAKSNIFALNKTENTCRLFSR